MEFEGFFQKATGESPFPFQAELATAEQLPDALNAPTGAGKTAALVLAWLWRRHKAGKRVRSATPRRLVYCLPMRVVVEQTAIKILEWIDNLKLSGSVELALELGGAGRDDWDLWPERDTVIVGTQDMLLSAALNRGFGTSRSRWPMRYGLLNSDCLWVFDEVQLMGSGLATAAQLQALRETLGTGRNCQSMWVSATFRPEWLQTVDFVDRAEKLRTAKLKSADTRKLKRRLNAGKPIEEARRCGDAKKTAKLLADKHWPGTMTLAVMNRVKRAAEVYGELKNLLEKSSKKAQPAETPEILLLHSRFRPAERSRLVESVLSDPPGPGMIVVSTQVVEAGVDISASTLVTDLAPWPSLVQRFGRCNRRGEYDDAAVYWLDMKTGGKADTAPYGTEELEAARKEIKKLKDVSPASLDEHLAALPQKRQRELFPYEPAHVIRRRDVIDLFDTTPDLAGNDVDVSRFIRDGDDTDAQVFWREVASDETPTADVAPSRRELCPVPVRDLRDFVKERRKEGGAIYRWDFLDGRWVKADDNSIYPGQVFCVPSRLGGYGKAVGWNPKLKDHVEVVSGGSASELDANDKDKYSSGPPQTIADHSSEVVAEARAIAAALGIKGYEREALLDAALWHDRGKAHEVFQRAMSPDGPAKGRLMAKSGTAGRSKYDRSGFRHELASALAMLQAGKSDLAAYLAAAHHGKVRLSIRSLPTEKRPLNGKRFARGIWDGDELPQTDLGAERAPPVTLSLAPMELGLSAEGEPSWAERMLALRDPKGMGPFRVAYLEALLAAADRRASAAHSRKERA